MKRTDAIALFLSVVAVAAAYLVADRVFDRMPHIEDEMAYVWQAQALTRGRVMLPSPPDPKSIMVPFVVDYHGQRFGKYPLGWPLMLALGLLLHARAWVNPVFAGLAVWLTYRLGQKLFDDRIALLAACLTLTSPFFLINSGSLLSHPWSLFLSLAFALAWLDSFQRKDTKDDLVFTEKLSAPRAFVMMPLPAWLTVSVAGLSLGVLTFTRPLTALGVGLPFLIHGIALLVRGDQSTRLRVLTIGLLAALIAALVPVWQLAVTGDPLLNPYTLWWKYDKVGFGEGFGRQAGGHSLHWAWVNLKVSFEAGWSDFFGWTGISWLFLPFGLLALGRNGRAWLIASVFPSIVLLYMAYWIGSNLYGPRYYYEGFQSLTLLSAAGLFWLAERLLKKSRARKWMQIAVTSAGCLLVLYNLLIYLPARLREMTGLYGIQRAMLAPFETSQAQELTPALVIVHFQHQWTEYGGLLELENADLSSPFIFALSRGPGADAALVSDFPDRRAIHYYTANPDEFFHSAK
jgi:hypothetical protein